ncbi:hormogonium polysaccharide biosynthesis glycosyltransferase HpsE [Planktothrix mougeotii]|uniref:Glycosyltransferase family 2 protein n=1 Tax=Planktothrix mougeotii LEGE 06226 TaxID=1828728 RepID=A0ABR9UDM6_9CYAN|nr:hormogonium polysaccharide biosynthesis glycosyltransferase HpsE [Planktothrix mougeotii]MBE9144576.1 glycosyltransferase family 2 protein [Planktothrix mougeotii LEGE 06226]
MVDITVAIPTYNGATRLPGVLEKLRSQIGTEHINWEILIVDNNSTDNTAELIKNHQKERQINVPLKYCLETKQGVAFARKRAIKESQAPLIAFLDDDNLPALDWVEKAYQFAQEYPQAGVYASQVDGSYEIEPPQNFERIAGFLGITQRGDKPYFYDPKKKVLPPGLALVVRKQAWCESVPEETFLTGPLGDNRLASEDIEAILYIQKKGWEIWYSPMLKTYHQIPAYRLERNYLINISRNTGLARHYIRMLRLKPWQRPLLCPLGLVNDIRKAIAYYLKHRKALKTDVVAACEMEFLRSSVISPFYLWQWKQRD